MMRIPYKGIISSFILISWHLVSKMHENYFGTYSCIFWQDWTLKRLHLVKLKQKRKIVFESATKQTKIVV